MHLYYLLTAFPGVHLPCLLPRYKLFIFKTLSSNPKILQLKSREKTLWIPIWGDSLQSDIFTGPVYATVLYFPALERTGWQKHILAAQWVHKQNSASPVVSLHLTELSSLFVSGKPLFSFYYYRNLQLDQPEPLLPCHHEHMNEQHTWFLDGQFAHMHKPDVILYFSTHFSQLIMTSSSLPQWPLWPLQSERPSQLTVLVLDRKLYK